MEIIEQYKSKEMRQSYDTKRLISPYIGVDIPIVYIKYLTMHTVQMDAGAIRKLVYGIYVCMEDNPFSKARGLSSQTDVETIQ